MRHSSLPTCHASAPPGRGPCLAGRCQRHQPPQAPSLRASARPTLRPRAWCACGQPPGHRLPLCSAGSAVLRQLHWPR
eukprot:3828148-Alexandrium_andersonii.AAC.1